MNIKKYLGAVPVARFLSKINLEKPKDMQECQPGPAQPQQPQEPLRQPPYQRVAQEEGRRQAAVQMEVQRPLPTLSSESRMPHADERSQQHLFGVPERTALNAERQSDSANGWQQSSVRRVETGTGQPATVESVQPDAVQSDAVPAVDQPHRAEVLSQPRDDDGRM